jgi:hypothetical protein
MSELKVYPIHESVEVVGQDTGGRQTIVRLERYHYHPDDDGHWEEWKLDIEHSKNLQPETDLKGFLATIGAALVLVENEPQAEAVPPVSQRDTTADDLRFRGIDGTRPAPLAADGAECVGLEARAKKLVGDMMILAPAAQDGHRSYPQHLIASRRMEDLALKALREAVRRKCV